MLNENDSGWLARELQSKAMDIQDDIRDVIEYFTQPSVLYRPRVFIDGDKWCALYGDNIQDGVSGFGSSPEEAMRDFNSSFVKKLGNSEIFPGTVEKLKTLSIKSKIE